MNTKIIKLDINKKLFETITAKQGDTKSRFILFNLYDGPIQFDLTGRTVRVYGEKKDNTTIFNDLVITDAKKGYCTLELTNQMLAVEGMNELELVIFEGEKRLSTMPFILNVIGSKYSEDAIVSTNEFTALMNALKTVGDIDNKAEKKEVEKLSEQLEHIAKSLDDFPVVGDGITDDTAMIQSAINYCTDHKINLIFGKNKKYLITKPLKIFKNNFEVNLNGSELIWNNTTNLTGNYKDNRRFRHYGFFSVLGNTIGNAMQITNIEKYITNGNYTLGQSECLKITVLDGTNFNVGDFIHAYTSIGGNLDKLYKPGFSTIMKIINKDNNIIYVDYNSPFDFSSTDFSDFFIQKVNVIDNVTIKNGILNDIVPWRSPELYQDGPNLDKVVCGVGGYYVSNLKVENIIGRNNKFPLVMIQWGYNISAINIEEIRPAYTSGGQGYTVHFCGVNRGYMNNIKGELVRHVADCSYSAFCTIDNIPLSTSYSVGFDLHAIYEHDIIINNINTSVGFGNGASYFPCMIENITVNNSNLYLFNVDSYIKNLTVNNSYVMLEKVFTPNQCVFNDCKINVKSFIDINPSYVSGSDNKLICNNCDFVFLSNGLKLRFSNYLKLKLNNCDFNTSKKNSIEVLLYDINDFKCNSNIINTIFRLYGTDSNVHKYLDVSNSNFCYQNKYMTSAYYNSLFDFENEVADVTLKMKDSIISINSATSDIYFLSDLQSSNVKKLSLILKDIIIENYTNNFFRFRGDGLINKTYYEIDNITRKGDRIVLNTDQIKSGTFNYTGDANKWLNVLEIKNTKTDGVTNIEFTLNDVSSMFNARKCTLLVHLIKDKAFISLNNYSVLNSESIKVTHQDMGTYMLLKIYAKATNSDCKYTYKINNNYTYNSIVGCNIYNQWEAEPTENLISIS